MSARKNTKEIDKNWTRPATIRFAELIRLRDLVPGFLEDASTGM
jgi:hypothetical protein